MKPLFTMTHPMHVQVWHISQWWGKAPGVSQGVRRSLGVPHGNAHCPQDASESMPRRFHALLDSVLDNPFTV
jgi:hypothetical protein